MPKIRPLTQRSRDEEERLRRNEVFCERLRTVYGRLRKTDISICGATGISPSCLYHAKNPEKIDLTRFGYIRTLAHEVGLTAEEWLRLGGYK